MSTANSGNGKQPGSGRGKAGEQAPLLPSGQGTTKGQQYYGSEPAPPPPDQQQMSQQPMMAMQAPSVVPQIFQTGVKYEFRFSSMNEFFVMRQGTNEAVTKVRHTLWKKKAVDVAEKRAQNNIFDASDSKTHQYAINLLHPATNELQMSVTRPDFRRGNYDFKNYGLDVEHESDLLFFGNDVSKPPVGLVSSHAVGCCPSCGCGEAYVEFVRMPGTKLVQHEGAATIFCTHSVQRGWSSSTHSYKLGPKAGPAPPFCQVTMGDHNDPVVLELLPGPSAVAPEWQRQLGMLVALRFACILCQDILDQSAIF